MKKLFKFLPAFIIALSTLVGCGPNMKDFIDYAHNGSFKLALDYEDKSFYEDGIAKVELKNSIDGDTAHFTPIGGGKTIKSRFYGINTPESTSQLQPYGQPASNFTKEKLKIAAEHGTIVVSSPYNEYDAPTPDSTGTRYVSLVWINLEKKDAPYDELICLNLWLAQEGLGVVQNASQFPEAEQIFYDAGNQAQKYKLNIYSDEPDPTFPTGDYLVTSLLELKRETKRLLESNEEVKSSPYNGRRVILVGAVAGYTNRNLYLQDYFNEEISGTPGGEYASINIFTGMSPIPSKYTRMNSYLQIHGTAKYDPLFGFQITDTMNNFPVTTIHPKDTDTKIMFKPDENVGDNKLHTFDYSIAQLNDQVETMKLDALNCSVKVNENLKVKTAYVNDDMEVSLTFEGCKFGAFIPFLVKPYPDKPWQSLETKDDFIGKTFNVQGVFTYHYKENRDGTKSLEFQVTPNDNTQITLVQAEQAA